MPLLPCPFSSPLMIHTSLSATPKQLRVQLGGSCCDHALYHSGKSEVVQSVHEEFRTLSAAHSGQLAARGYSGLPLYRCLKAK